MEGGLDFLDSLLKADLLSYTFGERTQITDIKELRNLIYQEEIGNAYTKAGTINSVIGKLPAAADTDAKDAKAAKLAFAQRVLLNLQLAIANHEIKEKPQDTKYQAPADYKNITTNTEEALPYFKLDKSILSAAAS